MIRRFVSALAVAALCLTVSLTQGARHEGGGEKPQGERSGGERSNSEGANNKKSSGKKPPGGSWSEYGSEGEQGKEQHGNAHSESGAEGAAEGHAAEERKQPQASGAEGAAAGSAATNRNQPQATGAEGAAAGHAAANRNAPAATGAQGAAAGYAAGKNNSPEYSGAQGVAAGAAVANNNAPAATGAQGAVAGYAAGASSSPQLSGAQGVAVGAAVANSNSPAMSGPQGAAAGYAAVRSSVNHPGMYGQQWYGDHQSAWSPTGWSAGAAWTPATWRAVAQQCNYGNNPPVSYGYGTNVTCVDGNVVINGQPSGTAEEFSQEAADIAETGTNTATSANDKWLPLGVFALVRNEHQHPQLIMQLAVNQHGVLRGNYTDEVTDSTLPIHGGVDGPTKRAAWTVGDNKYSVMEAGLNNLTQSEAPALVHKNGTTQRWLLVRLTEPSQSGH